MPAARIGVRSLLASAVNALLALSHLTFGGAARERHSLVADSTSKSRTSFSDRDRRRCPDRSACSSRAAWLRRKPFRSVSFASLKPRRFRGPDLYRPSLTVPGSFPAAGSACMADACSATRRGRSRLRAVAAHTSFPPEHGGIAGTRRRARPWCGRSPASASINDVEGHPLRDQLARARPVGEALFDPCRSQAHSRRNLASRVGADHGFPVRRRVIRRASHRYGRGGTGAVARPARSGLPADLPDGAGRRAAPSRGRSRCACAAASRAHHRRDPPRRHPRPCRTSWACP